MRTWTAADVMAKVLIWVVAGWCLVVGGNKVTWDGILAQPINATAHPWWRVDEQLPDPAGFITVLLWNTCGFDSVGTVAAQVAQPGKVYLPAMTIAMLLSLCTYLAPIIVGNIVCIRVGIMQPCMKPCCTVQGYAGKYPGAFAMGYSPAGGTAPWGHTAPKQPTRT